MADPVPGKTLWEMLIERLHGSSNGSGIPFWNPLDLRVGSAMPVAYSNGPQFAGYDFTVQDIREYTRRIGGQDYRFTDYGLQGLNTKTFEGETTKARVRVVPNQAGAHDSVLLHLYDEFGFAEDFLAVVKDKTGLFEARDDDSGETQTYSRINDLRDSYQSVVLVVSDTTPDGKAVADKTTPVKIEYWDYWRNAYQGGFTSKEFLFVEMNSDTGWFQIWRGREFFS